MTIKVTIPHYPSLSTYPCQQTPSLTTVWQPLWHPCDNHHDIHVTTTMTSTWQPPWHPRDNHHDIHVTTTMTSTWQPLWHARDNHHVTTTVTPMWQPLWHPCDNHYDTHVTTTMTSRWQPLGHPVPLGIGKGYTRGQSQSSMREWWCGEMVWWMKGIDDIGQATIDHREPGLELLTPTW